MLGKDLLQDRHAERIDDDRRRIAPVKRLGVIPKDPLHQPIDASAHDQIQLRRFLRIVPDVRHRAEDRRIDAVEFLELVDDKRQRLLLGVLDENAKDILESLGLPDHRQVANLGDLLLKPRAKILLRFSRNVEVKVRAILQSPLDQLRLANTPPARDHREARGYERSFTNLS